MINFICMNNNDRINILCSLDSAYDKHCLTMLSSLFYNNKDEKFSIYVIGQNLTSQQLIVMDEFIKKHGHEFFYYEADEQLLKRLPRCRFDFISVVAFMRCFMTEYLPADIHKVLYLDCDLVILKPIRKLWNTDISNVAVAVVEDMWSLQGVAERLNYDASTYSYFNSGVQLVNLDVLRNMDFSRKVLDFIEKNRENLMFYDQDVMNGLLFDKKKWLSPEFNMQDGFFRRRRKRMSVSLQNEVDKYLSLPAILHYTGAHKPWHFKCYHPLKHEYHKYRSMIPYPIEKPKPILKDWIEMKVNGVLYSLRLLKRKYKKIK